MPKNKEVKAEKIVKAEVIAKPEIKVAKEESLSDFDKATLERAFALMKAKNITKSAHRPNGKVIYMRPIDVADDMRDAIQVFLTEHKNASIHDLAEYAICVLLKASIRENVKQAMK